MSHKEEILEIIKGWQVTRFRDAEIPLADAALSVNTNDPLVEARPCQPSAAKWMMFNADTDAVAVFTHAGVWAYGTDINTGNYVPIDATAPPGLPDSRIQNTISHKCEYNFTFDTSIDDSLYNYTQALEEYLVKVTGFNRANRPRRSWQNGSPSSRHRFGLTSKIFSRKTPMTQANPKRREISYEVHPWITDAIENSTDKYYMPNPDKPKLYEYDSNANTLTLLELCDEPAFVKGDIIWMSFTIAYTIGSETWGPDIIPIEFVRVGRLPHQITTATDAASYPSLDDNFKDLPTGEIMILIRGPVRANKRKQSEEPEDSTTTSDDEKIVIKHGSSNEDLILIQHEDMIIDQPALSVEEDTQKRNPIKRKVKSKLR